MVEPRANLFAALVKAQQAARGVEKAGQVTFGNRYKYASSEDVIHESRQVLGASDLAFLATMYRVENRDGSLMLVSRYMLTHASGESLECESETPIVPDKGRPEDKATATAKTYDLAYQLRALLLLERVEEGAEVDSRDDTQYQPRDRRGPKGAQPEPHSETSSAKDQWPEARERWIKVLGKQLFADCVGCDVEQIFDYAPPTDPTKRAAVKKTLEMARADLDAMGGQAA